MNALTNLSTPEQRLHALQSALTNSLEAIQRAAAILRQMEEAKDDLGAVPLHILRTLRRVNQKLMLPEVAVRYSGALREAIAKLPLNEQENLTKPDATVSVALANGDMVEVRPDHLTQRQIRQVFGDGHLRVRGEQLAVMQPDAPARKRGRPFGTVLVSLDKERGVVLYHGHTISKSQLIRWLNEL